MTSNHEKTVGLPRLGGLGPESSRSEEAERVKERELAVREFLEARLAEQGGYYYVTVSGQEIKLVEKRLIRMIFNEQSKKSSGALNRGLQDYERYQSSTIRLPARRQPYKLCERDGGVDLAYSVSNFEPNYGAHEKSQLAFFPFEMAVAIACQGLSYDQFGNLPPISIQFEEVIFSYPSWQKLQSKKAAMATKEPKSLDED